MERKGNKPGPSQPSSKPISSGMAEARRLLAIVEKSQVPFGESAPIFARIKAQIDSGKSLSVEDHEHLLQLVKIVIFFQAEDGIRDFKVTGVQTCALPI